MPEMEMIAGDTIENQPERLKQTENVNWQEMMTFMQEQFSQNPEKNDKNLATLKKELKEELSEKIDDNSKKMEENSKKMGEKLDDSHRRLMEQLSPEIENKVRR